MRIGALTILVCLGSFPAVLSALDAIDLSEQFRLRGDYSKAESLLREALKSGSLSPEDHAGVLNNLADLLREEDRNEEARPYFERVLELRGISWQASFGAVMGLADIERQEDSWDQSLAEWNKAVAMAQSRNDSSYESYALRGLGETLLDRGERERAEPLLKRALALIDRNPNVPSYRVSVALDTLASLYRVEKKTAMAEELWTRELQLNRKQFGDYHPQTALVMGHLAEAWSIDGDIERARDYSRQATDIMKTHFAENSVAVAAAMVNQAVVEQRARQLQTAATLYSKAFGIFLSEKPSSNAFKVVAQMYANVLSQLHRGKEAKQIVAEAMAFHAK